MNDGPAPAITHRVPMIFPGQASQAVGMARDLADLPGPAGDFLRAVDRTVGFGLTGIMFDGPLETLTETRHAQPAILAHSIAVVLALRGLGIVPSLVAGHSLGEYSAAAAAGALTPTDALRAVCRRGGLMFAAGTEVPGAMAAGLTDGLFWWSLLVGLLIAGAVAVPINRWLIARGKGHAVVHAHHAH